jgi:hypothetical protein
MRTWQFQAFTELNTHAGRRFSFYWNNEGIETISKSVVLGDLMPYEAVPPGFVMEDGSRIRLAKPAENRGLERSPTGESHCSR